MLLNNLNNPNTQTIESFNNQLTSGLCFAIVNNDIFLTLNDNLHHVNIQIDYNIDLDKQIFSLFELSKLVKNVYEPKIITKGIHKNTDYIFTTKKYYYSSPTWIHSNRFFDYFLLKSNCEISDCNYVCSRCGSCEKCKCNNGNIKFGWDLKNHPFRNLLYNYLKKAESKSWKIIERVNEKSLIQLFNIKGFDYTTGQFTSTFTTQRISDGTSNNICLPNSATSFDSQFADHSNIFYLLPKDNIIVPYVIHFKYFFDDELDINTTQGIYYKEQTSQEFQFDIPSINTIFNLNVDKKRNNIPNTTFNTFEYNSNLWNTSTEIVSPQPKIDQIIFKDKNGEISGVNYKDKNLIEIDFRETIDFNNILGVIKKEFHAYNPIHYVYDENYANIKLNLNGKINEGERIILTNKAYGTQIIGIATENECCNELLECINYSGDYIQTFISTEIIQERYLLKVVVPKIIIMKNYDFIEIEFGVEKFESRIYNIKHNKETNETTFNINIPNIPKHLLNIQEWKFTYKMPRVYWFTFNPNQKSIDVLKEISNELNKIELVSSFVDKNSLIICKNGYSFNLEIVSKNMNILLNDYRFRQHNANGQKFNFNTTEFSGSTSGKNLIVFIPTKNDLSLGKNTLVKINNHNYDLISYTLFDNVVDYYTNFYLKDILYPEYKGLVILRYNGNYSGQLIQFLEKFQPKIYHLEVF